MPGPSPSPLLENFERQDDFFAPAFSILREAIAQRAFPGASITITDHARLVASKAFGHFTYDSPKVELAAGAPSLLRSMPEGGAVTVQPITLFDLASLTKVIATTTMAMILYERGLLDLNAPLAAIVPEFTSSSAQDLRRQDVTFRMILAHCSGLPAYEKLFLKAHTRGELLHAAFTTPLTADPATRAEYSDIGFILLGVALERLADEPLDSFCQREIFSPLGMTATTFNPPSKIRALIPPTADDRAFRHRLIQGEVQDENASVLGGVGGHAGVFSTAENLAIFAHAMLQGGRPILHRETVALFTRRGPAPAGTSRALGWDTPSAPSQSGRYFSPNSFGHLGYTGTSLWIDPDRNLSIALLTNRTWPDCSNHVIKQVRPRLHDAVVEAIESSSP